MPKWGPWRPAPTPQWPAINVEPTEIATVIVRRWFELKDGRFRLGYE